MNKVWMLAVAFLREYPARVVLTSLATTAATCMVIWVTAGYDALLKSFDVWANVALGHYELSIAPINHEQSGAVPVAVLNAMRADPNIATADPFWVRRTTVAGNEPRRDPSQEMAGRPAQSGPPNLRSEYTLIATATESPPFPVTGRWLNAEEPTAYEAVLRADTAKRLNVDVEDRIRIKHNDETIECQVIGLLEAPTLGIGEFGIPQMLTPGSGDVYVSTTLAERIFGEPSQISFVGVAMKPDADITRFRFGWSPKLSDYEPPVQFQEAHEIEERLDESATADNVRLQSYAATGIAMLVAILVIFCTVNMGVTERVRQFAILRAVALTRWQICQLIFAEGLLLAAIGFCGGLVISWLVLTLAGNVFARLLHHGAEIGPMSLTSAAVVTFGGAMLAVGVPAWRATRVRPADAMAPQPRSIQATTVSVRTLVIGMLLIAVNPLLTFVFPPRFESRVLVTLAIAFLSMSVGFVLIAPAIVAMVDRCFSPLLARLLAIDPKLIASQISTHIWRTTAGAISLAVGLALFIGIQVWGFTMLDAFIVGPWAPDAILAFTSPGLPLDHVREFQQIPGINSQECLPVVVEQPRLLHDVTGSADRASVTRQDNVVIVGIDPEQAFGGDHPLFHVDWAEGDPESAISQMKQGRGCLVPDHFLAESGLRLGDSFELVPPKDSEQPVKYTIAGALKLPGWHWQTKLTGFRTRTHRAAALVFASYSSVAEDFDLPTASHLWFNFANKAADPDEIVDLARRMYSATNQAAVTNDAGENATTVRIMPAEQIRQMTRRNAARWLWAVSQLPLVAVMIAGLGVLNIVLASVRSRQWELGVLRAIGISQAAIVRAILAEGLLIGVVACMLSLGYGLLAGWCGSGMAQYISFFGGLHPALQIPWFAILLGLIVVLIVTALAGLWPALTIGRQRPLALIQKGRTSF